MENKRTPACRGVLQAAKAPAASAARTAVLRIPADRLQMFIVGRTESRSH